MLRIYSRGPAAPQVWQPGATAISAAASSAPIWLDLVDPSLEERRQAELLLGHAIPTRDQTSALEISSRLQSLDDALCLNIPAFVREANGQGPLTPLGFVLTPTILASVRYADSLAFEQVGAACAHGTEARSGVDVFGALLEGIVDVAADRIETVAADLSLLTQGVFKGKRKQPQSLRNALLEVGAIQQKMTELRSAMLGTSRLTKYLKEEAAPWIDAKMHVRFNVVQADIDSLNDFDQHLNDRLQFLLDAVLGLINNEQNDIMRVLTVVSVATVPPILLAGIWGMNFKSIPEYDWTHGYAFGLSMIVVSTVLPLIWFKIKRWV